MSRRLNQKEIRDILPENNEGMELIPQILTNRAEDFLAIAKEIRQYGYDKVNLNLAVLLLRLHQETEAPVFWRFPGNWTAFWKKFLSPVQ